MSSGAIAIKTVDYHDFIVPIKAIRTLVFQQEQGVAAELEFDGLDADATHFLAYVNDKAVGTARIREIERSKFKIERLAVMPKYRQRGIGKQLMTSALSTIAESKSPIAIVHAQAYIAQLYRELGFVIAGDKFTEAGIVHVKMVKHL